MQFKQDAKQRQMENEVDKNNDYNAIKTKSHAEKTNS